MRLQTLFKQQEYLGSLERNSWMKIQVLIISTFLLFMTGCSFENKGEAEAIAEETEVKEVKNGDLDLKIDTETTENQTVFYITLTSDSNEMKKLEFPSSQKYEIIVKDYNKEEVFRYSKGKMFTQAIETALIKSGERMQWEEIWEHSNLPAGKYTVEVTILAHHTEDLKEKANIYIK